MTRTEMTKDGNQDSDGGEDSDEGDEDPMMVKTMVATAVTPRPLPLPTRHLLEGFHLKG